MKRICYFLLLLSFMTACQKQQDWLDAKVTKSSVVPARLSDFKLLLDGDFLFQSYGYLGLTGTDHLILTDADYNAVSIGIERNPYVWAKDLYEGRNPDEWVAMYKIIAAANVALEGVAKIEMTAFNEADWKQVKGTALFYRGLAYYQLLQFFAPPFEPATASTDMGVPLRLTSDVNERPGRASVAACYQQVMEDLAAAASLLPAVSSIQVRPTSAAAKGMLARASLMQENWAMAEKYAAQALSVNASLIDFNTLNSAATVPFPTLQSVNPEVLFHAESSLSNYFQSNRPLFDTTLYKTYATNDLRRTVFFRLFNNQPIFKGFYTGKNMIPFAGIATNELYLIRAEALARMGQKDLAMDVLNTLLRKRWKTGTYVPFTASTAEDALVKVITERRKELPFTGSLVWEDLRRLNRDARFARTLTRVIGGVTYTLPPKDPRYVLPIPDIEIRLTGIPQNIR